MSLGLPKWVRTTSLLEAMKVSKLTYLYFLYKLLFIRQIRSNGLAACVFDELIKASQIRSRLGHSYFGQLADVSGVLGVDCITLPLLDSRNLLDAKFKCPEDELIKKIENILKTNINTEDINALIYPLLYYYSKNRIQFA